jgi:hypothetical protein
VYICAVNLHFVVRHYTDSSSLKLNIPKSFCNSKYEIYIRLTLTYLNILPGRADYPGELITFAKTTPNFSQPVMPQRKNTKKPLNEADIQLAVQAIKYNATLSQRQAAKIYRVS